MRHDDTSKIIIAGLTQSGKTTLAEKFAEILGLKILKTCTTRPKRSPDEDSYHFYTLDEYKKLKSEEKFTETLGLDNYARWTNPKDMLEADICIFDPIGIPLAVDLFHKHGYEVALIYVSADENKRRDAALNKTGLNADTYDKRRKNEEALFHDLEEAKKTKASMYGADQTLYWTNDMTENSLKDFISSVRFTVNGLNLYN